MVQVLLSSEGSKILIANRGEIACRIIRTARRLGVSTVAVYSEADKDCIHVKMADEAYCIGPAASSESYLNVDKIMSVAKSSGAEVGGVPSSVLGTLDTARSAAPGTSISLLDIIKRQSYFFWPIANNDMSKLRLPLRIPSFAQRIADEGLVFIGPPAEAIRSMGSKRESKEIMLKAGVPCVPGYHGAAQDLDTLTSAASSVGLPLLIKPTHGGGGKGMRIVRDLSEFQEEVLSAKREAIKSFGNDEVLLERWLERPRHVEVQVFADGFGECVALWERDCSVQRRHQKIIEEAPAPGLSMELKKDLAEKAVAAAKAVNYVGAGTVEFIMDATTGEYFFMEIHPVTEMVTGVDLVEWQLSIAAGNHLPMIQAEVPCIGHAFEARIYAERPEANFLPDAGKLLHTRAPTSAPHRLETGFQEGDDVSSYYDPMIAKLIVHGKDRAEALALLRSALAEYQVVGPSTNIEFLKAVAAHPDFAAGPQHHDELFKAEPMPPRILGQAALFLMLHEQDAVTGGGPWSALAHRRFGDVAQRTYKFDDREVTVRILPSGYEVEVDGSGTVDRASASLQDRTELVTQWSDTRLASTIIPSGGHKLHIFDSGRQYVLHHTPSEVEADSAATTQTANAMTSPMPATVIEVRVKPGDKVEANQVVCVLESMKMEINIRAGRDGVVGAVNVEKGQVVEEGAVLVALESDESA
ncbi:hypothetical protein EHS25_003418 [Saitozyma podzolica]|uniref:Methylcrotonoyl-CoA carboxylase subunit alpha, mitochondrial n=1 Tax=Saitozyma podzolica TaxID=1890683 RepID=A0A427Y765_9TREE|nr:hypothetical protein EHS25_003418 [Saitozyma podzolica]